MANHMSSIGFLMQTDDDFYRYAMQAVENGEHFGAEGTFIIGYPKEGYIGDRTYVRWGVGGGAELWAQVNQDNELTGLHPHFSGDAVMRVGLTARVERPEENELDGAFHGWADPNPDGGNPESGAYPFVFDAPDYVLHEAVELPAVFDVQLAAFAHELNAYASDEEYYASRPGEIKFASESFIPSGLFISGGEPDNPPQSYAIFAGHVLGTSLLINPATGAKFHWAKVRTLGGEVDVVADLGMLNGSLIVGGVVEGSFWLSGLLLGRPKAKREGFRNRLFNS